MVVAVLFMMRAGRGGRADRVEDARGASNAAVQER
jgi:hypothetical protein